MTKKEKKKLASHQYLSGLTNNGSNQAVNIFSKYHDISGHTCRIWWQRKAVMEIAKISIFMYLKGSNLVQMIMHKT